MVNSNNLFKKKSGEKASDIATRCFVAIIILNIIMASLAILIPDSSLTLAKLYATFALFLLPALLTIGNLRYIEQYNTPVKILSCTSIIGSVLAVLCGIIYIWTGSSVSAISTVNDTPSSDYSDYSTLEVRSSNYLTEEYDDDDLYDYDDYDYDYDDDYYSNSYKTYNSYDDYDYTPSTYSSSSYTTGTISIADFIPIIPKIYLVSSIVMISAFFIASCLKYKNYSASIIGLKITSIICISYCCLVTIAFLLFPVPLNEMAARLAILALVLINGGFYSWLALVIIAHNEKRKASNIEDIQNETPIETVQDNTQVTPEPTPAETSTTPEPISTETPTEAPAVPEPTPAEAPAAPEPAESAAQPTPGPDLNAPQPTPEA